MNGFHPSRFSLSRRCDQWAGRAACGARAVLAAVALATSTVDVAGAATRAEETCNAHYGNSLTFPIPGRGLALSWAPAGSGVNGGNAIAVGGHLIGSQTYLKNGERYDTKLFDTVTGAYLKRFGVHYWWAISNTWTINPFIGEVIADGAGDHAVKIFDATAPGTNRGPTQSAEMRGRYAVEDGAIPGILATYGRNAPGLADINAWITSLAFSPDGAYLAGASKDGSIRIWQIMDAIHPEHQFRVVKVYYDPASRAAYSVRWSPDGTMLAAGFRNGRAAIYRFDPAETRWSAETIAAFVRVSYSTEVRWFENNPLLVGDAPLWSRSQAGTVWNVRYSPDGVYLAVAGDRATSIFDLSTTRDAGYPLMGEGHGLDFSPDGRALAVGGGDARVHVFRRASSDPPYVRHDVLQGHTENVVGAVAWSPDGSTLASVAGGPLVGDAAFNESVRGGDDTVRLWAPADGGGVPCGVATTTTTTSTTTTRVSSSTTTTTATTSSSTLPGSSTTTTTGSSTSTTIGEPSDARYPGFGHRTTGGDGYPTFLVTNSTDAGPGSLRDAFARAERAGGGIIRFAVSDSGDIRPGPKLIVPPNTTVDATGSRITLWGGNEGGGNGVLNVWSSNVVVIGLRIRNGVNDGIQIAPKNKQRVDIANIVIDRCSVTRNADGGIDVTGYNNRTVGGLTIMRSFIAGNGRPCEKGLCGGGSLFKYGAYDASYYANFFFANLQRTPLINGDDPLSVTADLRGNLVQATQASALSVRDGAQANIVDNVFVGAHDGARLWAGGRAFFGGGNLDQNTGSKPEAHLPGPLPVPGPAPGWSRADAEAAGATPRDAIDSCYLDVPAPTFAKVRAAPCTTGTTIPSTTTTTTAPSTTSTTTTTSTSSTTTTTIGEPSAGRYPGFGHRTTGGDGYPTFLVTNSADAGAGSLRDAFARAEQAGGGIIRFAVADAGDIHPGPRLIVPPNTTVDATGSRITLWGGNEGGANGVLNVWNGNVVVIGLRVRDGVNDGIQVAPKNARKQDIANVVIDRCSATNNADGGIDVTGYGGRTVTGVTVMRSFIAANGRHCKAGLCGGGSLFEHGAFDGSYYANFFFANLQGTPWVNGDDERSVVADLRANRVEATQSSAMSVRERAAANIVDNVFVAANDGARLWSNARAFFGGGNTDQNTNAKPEAHLAEPLAVPGPAPAFSRADAREAGALPRDAIDRCYLAVSAPSFSKVRAAPCAPPP